MKRRTTILAALGALLGLAAATSLPASRGATREPAAPASPSPSSASSNASCIACHADAHPGFARSGHAVAAVEPWYRASLPLFPREVGALCARCHAPAASDTGVTCAACHVEGGTVLVGRDASIDAPHPTRYAPELRSGALCARCHVVDLPVGRGGAVVRLQDPFAEHALWRARTGDRRGCVDCHVSGPAHFAGVRDAAFLAGAVRLELDPRAVRLANLTGHAFPTGSQLREAWLRVDLVARDGRRVEVYARRFSLEGDDALGEPKRDLRLAPGATLEVPLAIDVPADLPRAGLALEATVDLALVSLIYPDSHPMIPPGEPRTVPVARRRIEIPEDR